MIGIFRQKNSANALLLLVYGLLLKFNLFLHPKGLIVQHYDHYLFRVLVKSLEKLDLSVFSYSFLSFSLLFLQATLFNRICNSQKMFSKPNYLAGMSYLLVSSLMEDWNRFSAPLLINTLIIWLFYRMMLLYNSIRPGTAIFNIGLIMGLITLLYKPAIVYVLLVFLALYIMRAFQLREWLVGLLGITTPYYFLALLLYLTNSWSWEHLSPFISFELPAIPSSVFITISLSLLIIPFIIGGYYVQNNLTRMLIQVRKNWSLLLLLLIISMVVILVDEGGNYVNWSLCLVPLSAFHAATYFYPPNSTFPMLLHWITFFYAIYVNYFLPQ